jgi:histidine triad (HIT) family protein
MSDCIFCKIIAGQIPGEMVYQDQDVAAFKDINPKAPVHILIVPKKHIVSVSDLAPEDTGLAGKLLLTAKTVAAQQGLKAYKLVVNTGAEAGQVVMHLHLHLLGGRKLETPV